jgi:hypothetical protein
MRRIALCSEMVSKPVNRSANFAGWQRRPANHALELTIGRLPDAARAPIDPLQLS